MADPSDAPTGGSARETVEGMEELFNSFDDICSRRGKPELPSDASWLMSQSSSVESLDITGAIGEDACTVESGSVKKPRPPRLPHPPSGSSAHLVGEGDNARQASSPSRPRSPSWTEELTRRRAWEAEWSKLKEEEKCLMASECNLDDILHTKLMSSSQLLELRQELDWSSQENKIWSTSLWNGLQKIRANIACLRHDAGQRGQHRQSIARSIENDISEFKTQQHQQFDALQIAEVGFEEIQNVLAQRYEGWVTAPSALFRSSSLPVVLHQQQSGGSAGSRSRGPSADPPAATADPEIEEIRTALEALGAETQHAGGSTGGWSDLHHDVFMRIYRKFKMQATPAFFSQLERHFPDISKSDLADHVRWFVEDEQRLDTKRRLLERWRERREELRREASAVESKLAADDAEHSRQAAERDRDQRAEMKRRLAEWRSQRAQEDAPRVDKQSDREKDSIRVESERRQQKEAVEDYKHRREAERLQSLRELKQAKEEQSRIEQEQRREQLQKREMVEAYRRQRDMVRARGEEQQAEAASAAKRTLSQDERQRIAKRNHELLKRRGQASVHPEDQRNSARFRRGSEPPGGQRSTYDDVPSRLHDPTTSFTQKTLQGTNFEDKPIQNIGASSEPGWRCQLRTGRSSGDGKWHQCNPPSADTSLKMRALAIGSDSFGRAGVVTQPMVSSSSPRMPPM